MAIQTLTNRSPVFDPVLWLALTAVLPAIAALAASTALIWQPHWPGLRVVLMGVVAAPVLEEIVFRGGLQEWLIGRTSDRSASGLQVSVANLVASAVFAAMHLLHHPPLWAGAMFVPSLIFGVLYERQRRLWPPMLVHALYNAAYLFLLAATS